MPRYDYECNQCGYVEEFLLSYTERDNRKWMNCLHCKGMMLPQIPLVTVKVFGGNDDAVREDRQFEKSMEAMKAARTEGITKIEYEVAMEEAEKREKALGKEPGSLTGKRRPTKKIKEKAKRKVEHSRYLRGAFSGRF